MTKVEIFFDFLSPFSYLAVEEFSRLKQSGELPELAIVWRPVIMSQLIHAYETKGPAEIASKRDFLFRQVLRIAERSQIAVKVPKQLPFNSLEALRLTLYWAQKGVDVEALVLSFFRAAWAKGADLGDLDILTECMQEVGLDAKEGHESSGKKEVRLNLKENLKLALAQGVFGVPTFIAGDELFWGRDSLPDLVSTLKGAELPRREVYEEYLRRF